MTSPRALTDLSLRHWPLAAAIAAAAMLAIAHAFQTFGHLAPCELCLKARTVYWGALGIGLFAWISEQATHRPWIRTAACVILALVFLYGTGLAVFHAGVEWKFWPGPKSCTGAGGPVTAAGMAALLNGEHITPPQCDKAAWVFLGLSMAGWNAIASLILTVLSVAAGVRARAARA